MSREASTEIGSRVRFSTQSVFLPNSEEAVSFASGCDVLEGIVVGFSDSGVSTKVYAVVEVVRRMSLVLPLDGLSLVSGSELEEKIN